MGNIWSQSVARRALVGAERTHNPSPAASALLGKFGRRGASRFRKALSRLGHRTAGRRSFHRGNPIPAVLALGGGLLGKLGGRFKTPSEKRAGPIAQQLVNAAVNGNLTAANAIAERTEIGIQKERAIWRKAFSQIPPAIIELVKKYHDKIPGVDQSSPEAAGDSAIARAVNGLELEAAAKAEVAAGRAAGSAAAARRQAAADAKQATREAQLAAIAGTGLQALAGRGRRPAQRRRPRRKKSRQQFDF